MLHGISIAHHHCDSVNLNLGVRFAFKRNFAQRVRVLVRQRRRVLLCFGNSVGFGIPNTVRHVIVVAVKQCDAVGFDLFVRVAYERSDTQCIRNLVD